MNAILCVGGVFNDEGGRRSNYFGKLVLGVVAHNPHTALIYANGGTFGQILYSVKQAKQFDTIIWAADVPNDKPKFVDDLKVGNQKAMLVITKNNMEKKYTRMHLTARALKAKANLLIEFTKDDAGKVLATLIDPLGNCFLENCGDINTLAKVLSDRLTFLHSMTRVGSECVGDRPQVIPVKPDTFKFFDLVKDYAKEFHHLIHLDDNERMLGNLSFRCEAGFPSLRWDDCLMVSRRNVDKRDIGIESVVPIELGMSGTVRYLGDDKPSVDTPLQRRLYCEWDKAMYMLHAHVYIDGAPMTDTVIPCGAMQEADEVLAILPRYDGTKAAYINLRGHGSIAVASEVGMLSAIPYIPRPLY